MSSSNVNTIELSGGTSTARFVGDTDKIVGGGGGPAAVVNPPETVARSTFVALENGGKAVLALLVGGLSVQVILVRYGQPGVHLSVSVRLLVFHWPVTLRLVGVMAKLPTHNPGFEAKGATLVFIS